MTFKNLTQKVLANKLHYDVTVQCPLKNKKIKVQTELPLMYGLGKLPKMACRHVSATYSAAPIMIWGGSRFSSGCLFSKTLLSVPHSSRELGMPGGQKGMYRNQGKDEK